MTGGKIRSASERPDVPNRKTGDGSRDFRRGGFADSKSRLELSSRSPDPDLTALCLAAPAPGSFSLLTSSWLAVSMILLELGLAILVYLVFLPDPVAMQTLAAGWVVQIWLRNLCLLFLVAHGLHLYFHQLRQQGTTLKFDRREIGGRNGRFTYRSQLLDNMFWSLASGVTVWTAYEALYFLAMANGLVPVVSPTGNPVWFAIWLLLIPIWSSLHFYWVHRLLRWPPLYRIAHSLHHRNINVGPWSGISMHPIEHLLYFWDL